MKLPTSCLLAISYAYNNNDNDDDDDSNATYNYVLQELSLACRDNLIEKTMPHPQTPSG